MRRIAAMLLSLAGFAAPALAGEPLPRVATAAVGPGQYAFAPDPYSQAPYESELLLVRERTGRLRVWFIPVREGLRRLPADAAWAAGLPCARFSVDFDHGVLACSDPSLPARLAERYRWRLDGHRLSEFVPDLLRVPGSEVDGFFVLHRPGKP